MRLRNPAFMVSSAAIPRPAVNTTTRLIMGLTNLLAIGGGLFVLYLAIQFRASLDDAPVPILEKDKYWGIGEYRLDPTDIRGFKIQVSDQVITDLDSRLGRFLKKPIVSPLENVNFEYGFNSDYLRQVIQYWKDEYVWKEQEKFLNQFPQFVTTVNGLKIHFLRLSPSAPAGKKVLPLLMLHGWPGSVREFYEMLPMLTQPNPETDFVFEVIVPSLPGYGWSEAPAKPGMGPAQVAVIMNNLMNRLGFQKYYLQGGDWGALIVNAMGKLYGRSVLGVHSNMCSVNTPYTALLTFIGSYFPSLVVEKENQHMMYPFSRKFFFLLEESGYFHIQATKPDTIGTALSDTPAGLAAYILEKFSTWTNPEFKKLPDGGLPKKFKLDALLDNIMIYWVTNSITTSQRLYSEAFTFNQMGLNLDSVPIHVPTACARFHHDLTWQSTTLLNTSHRNLVHVSDFSDGGHFAAFELPDILAKDIFQAVKKMDAVHKKKVINN